MNLESKLRSLDVAAGEPNPERRVRGASLLEHVVHDVPEIAQHRRRRTAAKVGGLVAAGAAVATLAMVIPGLSADPEALASWTPTAEPVSDADLAPATEACEADLANYQDGASISFGEGAEWVLSERRGDIVAMVLWQPNPDLAFHCLVDLPVGSTEGSVIGSGAAGSDGPALEADPGTIFEGAMSQQDVDGQPLSIAGGSVGEDVVGLTIHAGDQTIEATIEDGRYVAWWPGAAFDQPMTGSGSSESGEGGPMPIMTYDLTLADGTVITDVPSTFPAVSN